MNKGEPGIPGGGPFDTLMDDVYHMTPLVLSGQFAGDYLHRDAVVRLVERHAQRHASNHNALQNAQMVAMLNNLMSDVMGAASTLDPDRMHTSVVMKKFLAAIQKIQSGEK